jgi:hypothetical protein
VYKEEDVSKTVPVYKIDDIVKFSKCPMMYLLSTLFGTGVGNNSVHGQLTSLAAASLRSFISNANSPNARAVSSRKYNDGANNILVDPLTRGSSKRKADVEASIEKYRRILEVSIEDFAAIGIVSSVSPYVFSVGIAGDEYTGSIEAVVKTKTSTLIVYVDMNKTEPTEEYLDSGAGVTTSVMAYTMCNGDRNVSPVHYWLHGNRMYYVDRTQLQINSVKIDIVNTKKSMLYCIKNKTWYRSRSMICSRCTFSLPCSEVAASTLTSI